MLQDRDLLSVQEARDMVRKARVAFEAAKLLSQEQIDKIVKAMSDVAYAHSEELAKMAAAGAPAFSAASHISSQVLAMQFFAEG